MDKKKLRYAIAKELDKGNTNISAKFFGVTDDAFLDQVSFLVREGYITKPMYADNTVWSMNSVSLTSAGEDYLSKNSSLAKAYSIAKEIKDWIK